MYWTCRRSIGSMGTLRKPCLKNSGERLSLKNSANLTSDANGCEYVPPADQTMSLLLNILKATADPKSLTAIPLYESGISLKYADTSSLM